MCQAKLDEIHYQRTYMESLINENKDKIFQCIDLRSVVQINVKKLLLGLNVKFMFFDINFDKELAILSDTDDLDSDRTGDDGRVRKSNAEPYRDAFGVAQRILFFPTNKRHFLDKIVRIVFQNIESRIIKSEDPDIQQKLKDFFFNNKVCDEILNCSGYQLLATVKEFIDEGTRTIFSNTLLNYHFMEYYNMHVHSCGKNGTADIRCFNADLRSLSGLSMSGHNFFLESDFSVLMTPKRGD